MIDRKPVIYAEAATLDVDEIFDWVYEKSRNFEVAAGFVRRIEQCCRQIGNAPNGGSTLQGRLPHVRLWPFEKSAVIVYRVLPDAVEVLKIFPAGRDYQALLLASREIEDE